MALQLISAHGLPCRGSTGTRFLSDQISYDYFDRQPGTDRMRGQATAIGLVAPISPGGRWRRPPP